MRATARTLVWIGCLAGAAALTAGWLCGQFWASRRTITLLGVAISSLLLLVSAWYVARSVRYAAATVRRTYCLVLWQAVRQLM